MTKKRKDLKYAAIIPLVGGMNIGMEKTLGDGRVPEWIVSYPEFAANDQLLLDYYDQRGLDVPYHVLNSETNDFDDDSIMGSLGEVDIVTSLCPCAGLSQLNSSAAAGSSKARGADAEQNDWMYKSSRFILEKVQPKVLWGENAPNLFTALGEKVRQRLYAIAKDCGYSFSIVKTSTLFHGIPQNRSRTFFFFWKSEHAPLLNYIKKDHKPLDEYLKEIPADAPNKDFFYQNVNVIEDVPPFEFLLETSGLEYKEFLKKSEKFSTIDEIIQKDKYHDFMDWWNAKYPNGGTDKQNRVVAKMGRIYDKTVVRKAGGYWDSGPKHHVGYTNAIISKNASWFLHPDEPRLLNGRELIHMMAFPHDFEVKQRDIHKITQNVPACTAADWGNEVAKFCLGELECSGQEYLLQSNYQEKVVKDKNVYIPRSAKALF